MQKKGKISMALSSKDTPDFQIFSAQELAAQRVVLAGDVQAERTVDQADCVTQGDWVYTVEEDGNTEGLQGAYAIIVSYEGSSAEVEIPDTLGGLEVRELFNQVFARNSTIESVVMPNTVVHMGLKTFFQCTSLKRVRLSDAIQSLDSQTFGGCRALADVHLPASLKSMPKRLLFDSQVKTLRIPRCTEAVEEQSYNPKTIESIEVDSQNTMYSTDGRALFSKDGQKLIMLAVPAPSYTVPDTCSVVCEAAFKGHSELEELNLGAGVREIGDFSFFRTGIASVVFPSSLETIGASAFSLCAKLEQITFADGLKAIGDQAFSKTGISNVLLPKSLERLGKKAFERCKIDFGNADSFAIDGDNPTLFTDGTALYSRTVEGVELSGFLNGCNAYEALPETTSVAVEAFERESKLESITFCEGLRSIGDKAFKMCDKLQSVSFPDSLEYIGEEAFWQTSLSSAHIGPNVKEIGPYAFEVAGATRKHERRTLRHMDVDEANERYYYEQNILIERCVGGDRAIMFVEPRDYVEIPRSVAVIDETAFYHAHVREMRFHSGIRRVAPRALLGIDNIDRVYVEFPEPVDGFSEVTVEFPYQARDMEDFTRPLCIDDDGLFFDFATYDSMVVHEIDPTAVVRMILSRFEQPVKLGDAARAHFEAALKGLMNAVLRRYAQDSNFEGYDRLARNGYLDEQTLELARKIAESEGAHDALQYLSSLKK